MATVQRVQRGQKITAEAFNALADAVNALRDEVDRLAGGGPADLREPMLVGRVRAVRPVLDPVSGLALPETVYDVLPIGRGDESLIRDVRPLLRPVKDGSAGFRAAAVGDAVLVLRLPAGDGGYENHCILSEPLSFGRCG